MKKATISLLFLFFAFVANATNPSMELDENEIQNEFRELDKVEDFVNQNKGITISELQKEHSELIENLNLEGNSSTSLMVDQLPLASGFWWGCCLGPVGLALVYLITDNDREEVKNALIGCVILTLLGGGWLGIFGNPFN